jgi:hypothetical protein
MLGYVIQREGWRIIPVIERKYTQIFVIVGCGRPFL